MNRQSLTLSSGNKGAIFSIDVAIAFFIVAIVLFTSAYYAGRQNQDYLANLQMYKAGYDVVTVLDYKNILNTTDNITLQSSMYNLTAVNYLMKIRIDDTNGALIIMTNDTAPTESLVLSGERPIMRDTTQAIARFWIWPR
ncbi:MAG TPA: hypothetical protein VJB94_04375 [Candidatus Nanoarchaeia archaeon]|nr:hypothetical protein [Candidatus Nanoarchaeia archaeon]